MKIICFQTFCRAWMQVSTVLNILYVNKMFENETKKGDHTNLFVQSPQHLKNILDLTVKASNFFLTFSNLHLLFLIDHL